MKQREFFRFIFLLQLFFSVAVTNAYALNQVRGDSTIMCSQSQNKQDLACQYRNKNAEAVLAITAEYAGNNLPVKEGANYPHTGAITAVLLLLDTSDPARQNVIDKNIEHIKMFLSKSSNYHRFGLASFDKELRLDLPIGSDHGGINDAAKKLKAVGSTTELYRNMLEAISLFKDVDAARKSIFLFSDGLAEDKAYFHNDVIKAANEAGIIITSIGYPRSVAQSVSLQTLRRLSEETGGAYVEANNQFEIPANFKNDPFASLDNGGTFNISLRNIINEKTNGENIIIKLETDIGTTRIPLAVEFNPTTSAQIPMATTVKQLAVLEEKKEKNIKRAAPPVQIVSPTKSTNVFETWLWYGIPVALLVLMILTIATFFMMLRRQNKNQGTTIKFPEVKPYAFLISQDETKTRYPITRTTCRLGRSKNNEITLRDSSVSRRHAEIHRDQGDEFTLLDLESLNGVFVNNEKIGRYKLHEGDLIEIGDVNLRFSLMPTDYQSEESTVMQDTKFPSMH